MQLTLITSDKSECLSKGFSLDSSGLVTRTEIKKAHHLGMTVVAFLEREAELKKQVKEVKAKDA